MIVDVDVKAIEIAGGCDSVRRLVVAFDSPGISCKAASPMLTIITIVWYPADAAHPCSSVAHNFSSIQKAILQRHTARHHILE